MRIFAPFILIITLCLGACSPGHNDYSCYSTVADGGWAYEDTLTFAPDSMLNDSVMTAAIKIAVRHDNNYPYSNLWVEVSHSSPDGVSRRDTVNIPLADVYGRWLGNGFGADYQKEAVVAENAAVDMRCPVTVRHIMRVDTLHGVEQVGVSIVPVR